MQCDAEGRSDFGRKRIHVVQVGLGTNSTFVQNLGGVKRDWCPTVDWLLETVSERNPEELTGVGVEPVAEHAEAMRAITSRHLPKVALLQVALGEADEEDVEIHALTDGKNEEVLMQVPKHKRKEITHHLAFLRNMSCVGSVHPEYEEQREWLQDRYGVDVNLASIRTSVWSYGRLARELNFLGCELLIIDAEGCDAAILRSLVAHCREEESYGRNAWPYVIQFETMGHCDRIEGANAEWDAITELQRSGYTLAAYSHYNSQLVHSEALKIPRIDEWACKLQCWAATASYSGHSTRGRRRTRAQGSWSQN